MQKSPIKFAPLAVAALLGSLSLAAAHGHGQESSPAMEMGMLSETRPIVPATNSSVTSPESYFQYGEHSTLIFCHIMLMSISWIFVLPIGRLCKIMTANLSDTRHRCNAFHRSISLLPIRSTSVPRTQWYWSFLGHSIQCQYS